MSEAVSTPSTRAPTPSASKRPGGSLLKKLLLMLISLVITIGLAEVVVRLMVPVRSVGPVGTTYDPVYGKSLKKSFSCWRTSQEFRYRLTTNSLGFRGPEPEAPPKDTVLFLGDSMTMGTGVNDGEEFPQVVRSRLAERFGETSFTVVNIGVANNGNGRWVKFLRNEGERFDPRYVFLQVLPNDFRDNARERLFALSESGQLQELRIPQPGTVTRLQSIIESIPGVRYSYLVALLRQSVANFGARGRTEPTEAQIAARNLLTYRIIEEALKVCRERGWPVAGILAESEDRWTYEDDQREHLQSLFESYGAPLIRVPSKRERPDLYFTVDPHWNTDGHRWVADAVYEHLLADPKFQTSP